ncbi:hypothetical protein AWC38_SpisGene6685 [Stylophora pistillata]|uniref:Uncharacterized protein n=1 Tax=Stylophora pistillata TaxID=50429 RepID=A0A2B4SI99_STYPI|nr:hypothetical protein AWC38_SpisGene6685 [Stylophora pistillata]
MERVKEMLKKHPHLKQAEIQSAFVMSSLQTEENWEKVEKEATQLLEKMDRKSETKNPDRPSFVFKTSEEKMKAALNIDRNGQHFLKEEYCSFDGKDKRCRNFVTLTASVYQPLLKGQIPLAVMEDKQESSQNIALFWSLQRGSTKSHRGQQDGISSSSNLKETYLEAKKSLEEFINQKSERQFLSSWLSWWDNRRTFIFRAFAPTNAPRMNQAEVIHTGWAHKDLSNLSLLDAAHMDTKDSVLFAVELQSIEKGTSKGGTGPSYEWRKINFHHRELERANQLGKEMMRLASINGLFIDPNSGHHPPENKTTCKRKQHKHTEVESPNVEELPDMGSPCLQQQNFNNSGFSLEPMQWPDRATAQQTTPAFTTVQSNAVHIQTP